VLAQAGMAMDDLVSVQVFCADVALLATFDGVQRTHFAMDSSARAFIGSGQLFFGARFAVGAVAVRRKGGGIMAPQRATDEADIRQRIDTWLAALRAMDLEGVMALYAPDIVSFDVVPPLRHVGAEAKRKNWVGAFAAYQPPLGYEMRDLTITVGDDVAFGHSLNRISGTLQNGHRGEVWLRWTACFRKIDGTWLIAHDQVSVPVDFASGRALLDLEP
jgi:uncharacterized protein (TIGR02246 family)